MAKRLLLPARALADPAIGDAADARPLEHVGFRLTVREQARGVLNGLAYGQVLEEPASLHDRRHQATGDGLPRVQAVDADVPGTRVG
jgi:hypothetical protein